MAWVAVVVVVTLVTKTHDGSLPILRAKVACMGGLSVASCVIRAELKG